MAKRDEQVQLAQAIIEESKTQGIDFIIVYFDGIELPCLREVAENLCIEAGQKIDMAQAMSITRAHDLYHRLNR